jgi:hypothetical protein
MRKSPCREDSPNAGVHEIPIPRAGAGNCARVPRCRFYWTKSCFGRSATTTKRRLVHSPVGRASLDRRASVSVVRSSYLRARRQFFTDWKIREQPLYGAPLLGIVLYFGLWAGALAARSIVRSLIKSTGSGGPKPWVLLATAALTGAIAGYLFVPFADVLIPVGGPPGTAFSKWHVMTFGTPLAVGLMLIAGVLHIGLMGRGMTDAHREW